MIPAPAATTWGRGWVHAAPVRYLVNVQGQQVGIERVWSKRPRLLLDGKPLPADQWERHLLTLADGRREPVRVGFGAWVLSPRLEVGALRYPIGRPLPRWVLAVLVIFVVLGFAGGAVGVLLAFGAAIAAVRLLIDPHRRAGHVVAAVGVLLLAVVVYALFAALIGTLG